MAAATGLGDTRAALYGRLQWRNRVVAVLRWLVPASGVLLLLLIVVQIVIDNLSQQFGFANIRIDRNNLVVDRPELTAIGEDGTLYALTATEAKVSVADSNVINMQGAVFTMTAPGGTRTEAAAEAASFMTDSQLVDVPGTVTIASSDGLGGRLTEVGADLTRWSMTAEGDVELTMADGSRLTADRMRYDIRGKLFVFEGARLVLPELPGGEQ